MQISGTNEYDTLLARQHAMRLRRQILTPGSSAGEPGEAGNSYDGAAAAADQQMIRRHLEPLLPFDALITHLYASMFRRRPYLRRLFPESLDFQREHLGRMFQHLIDHLHRPDELTVMLGRLGGEHRKLGVWPAQYEAFEEALCEALRRQAGQDWCAEAEEAWLRMLRFAVDAMVAGADRALAEPPYWHATVTGHERIGAELAILRVRTGEPYPLREGQDVTVESPLLPHAWRWYPAYRVPGSESLLEFHVRRTGPGGVSAALVEHTRAGDSLRLGPPRQRRRRTRRESVTEISSKSPDSSARR
ncbi:globin domain-containing protein [Streptomyces vilmorinianum]|uniref:globin domain-containing protein n=1 Tax=Streptomyces vilmorinianum TaxID=3051092 RepID=UPI0020C7B478|nr:globin domain-containing protein [Streptomyces vilmorinianum]